MSDASNTDIRIVVADDEDIVCSLVRDALTEEGYHVWTAKDGRQALQQITDHQANLVIADIRMPRVDGIEMVRQARETRPDFEVIFMTGYANLNSAKEAIKQGALEYILKPFELTEIRQAVSRAVDKIRRETAEVDPDQQLDRLSDLNHMLYSADDRNSLTTISLKFAMMHCGAARGGALFWNTARTEFTLVTIVDNRSEEKSLPAEPILQCLDSLNPGLMGEAFHVTRLEEHPLQQAHPEVDLKPYMLPPELEGSRCVINVPVARADTLHGLLLIGFEDDAPTMSDADLKFVSITGSQLALSLENIILLEETQTAYTRLRELQDETIQLEKMAARGEMSAEIGHELNNFLGVISGNVSLLEHHLREQDYDQLDKYVAGIADNVEKIKTFTSNLMDLTPISSKKEVLDFADLLKEVINYLRPQKRYQGVHLRLNPISQPIPFEADVVHVQQLLHNLFNNAADATGGCDRREITVDVTVDHGANTFTFSIADTGIGIKPELLAKAFNQRFTTKEGGHGFGLLVCRRVVESHDGQLQVHSVVGEGTTVVITLPLACPVTADAVH